MEFLERHWAPILVVVATFGIRYARYLQWKWTKEITEPDFQLRWLLNIYGQGFAYVVIAMWAGLMFVTMNHGLDSPRELERIETPAKLLKYLQECHDASVKTTEVFRWFIFFCACWVGSLFACLPSVWKKPDVDGHRPLPEDLH